MDDRGKIEAAVHKKGCFSGREGWKVGGSNGSYSINVYICNHSKTV